MPELPEIETIKLQLGKVLIGERIKKVIVLSSKSVHGDPQKIEGLKIIGVRRIAKVLLVDLEKEMCVAFHFKMTGQLILERERGRIVGGHPTKDFVGKLPSSHTRASFQFDKATLFFNDQRRFGWIKIDKRKEIDNLDILANMGPEPFEISPDQFVKLVKRSKRAIKLVIMDQQIISGVGNIYANDALWEAGIRPDLTVDHLAIKQLILLFEKIKLVLKEGIKYGGATAADAKYMNLHGLGGHYQDHFRVYDRKEDECLRKDGGKIKKITLGGRGTYFCPICQL